MAAERDVGGHLVISAPSSRAKRAVPEAEFASEGIQVVVSGRVAS